MKTPFYCGSTDTHGGIGVNGYLPDYPSAGGSGLIVIQQRWHDLGRVGCWLVTLVWAGWSENLNCVVDDFGNLVYVK